MAPSARRGLPTIVYKIYFPHLGREGATMGKINPHLKTSMRAHHKTSEDLDGVARATRAAHPYFMFNIWKECCQLYMLARWCPALDRVYHPYFISTRKGFTALAPPPSLAVVMHQTLKKGPQSKRLTLLHELHGWPLRILGNS